MINSSWNLIQEEKEKPVSLLTLPSLIPWDYEAFIFSSSIGFQEIQTHICHFVQVPDMVIFSFLRVGLI